MTIEEYLAKQVEKAGVGKSKIVASTLLEVLAIPFRIAFDEIALAFYPHTPWRDRVVHLFFLLFFLVSLKYFLIVSEVLLLLFVIYVLFETRRYRTTAEAVRKKYPKEGPGFTRQEYVVAAKALREFEPMTSEEVVRKHGQRIFDLLMMADAIHVVSFPRWRRTVSIEKIEKDRLAD